MALFRHLYNKIMFFSRHPHAPYYLAGVSFVESSFFPIPPDVMLIPMLLAHPLQARKYTIITIVASILGGIAGYLLGFFAFEWVGLAIIKAFGYEAHYEKVMAWFELYGFWAVLLAGFTPIPYKLFTIASGALQMAMGPFILASALGRSLRFFMVSTLVCTLGRKYEPVVLKYIEKIGWFFLAGLLVLALWFKVV